MQEDKKSLKVLNQQYCQVKTCRMRSNINNLQQRGIKPEQGRSIGNKEALQVCQ